MMNLSSDQDIVSPLSMAPSSVSANKNRMKRPADLPLIEKFDAGEEKAFSKLKLVGAHGHCYASRTLDSALDMSKFLSQVKNLIDQPIKIPGTLTNSNNLPRSKQMPSKSNQAKRDLLSVEDIWEDSQQHSSDLRLLYNTENVGKRKWLLELLMEESDPDSGGEEQITEQDLKELLKIHQKRRKFQQESHTSNSNSYTYYGAGLISVTDFYDEKANSSVLSK